MSSGRRSSPLAVLAMGIVSIVLFIIAPLTVEVAAPGFDPATRGALHRPLPGHVLHAGAVRRLHGARRGPHRRAAVLLLRRRAGALQPRHRRRDAPARGLASGSSRRPSGRSSGPRCTSGSGSSGSRARRFARGHACACGRRPSGSSSACSCPRSASGPLDALMFIFFGNVASTISVGSLTSVDQARNFQSLPGEPHRRDVRARRRSRCSPPATPPTTDAGFTAPRRSGTASRSGS